MPSRRAGQAPVSSRASTAAPIRRGWAWLFLCLLLLVSGAFAQERSTTKPEADAPRIGVMLMAPGEIFWERFGHNAILVVEPDGEATSYNFGFFDLDEPDFIARFVRGDMRYMLAALPYQQDLVLYREEGRGVIIQWLDLTPAQSRELAEALALNALPQNARYRYDYFKDNCSTRVRDALDRALGGDLRRQVDGRSHGLSWRDEALRLASPAPWMWLGFDLGLGPAADQPMTLWEEAFVPRRLSDTLHQAKNAQGAPLVIGTQPVLPHRVAPDPDAKPVRWWLWTASGLAMAAAIAWLGRRRPRALAAFALPFWGVAGLAGGLMLFLWFGTEHRMGWSNHNLFLLNPLAWLALPGGWRVLRGRAATAGFQRVLVALTVMAAIGLFVHWLPAQPQQNGHWIGLLLPLHLALAWVFHRARR